MSACSQQLPSTLKVTRSFRSSSSKRFFLTLQALVPAHTVKPTSVVFSQVKKTAKKFSLSRILGKEEAVPQQTVEEQENSGMSYEVAYRTPYKLEPFSYKYAFRNNGSANEASTVRNLLDLAYQRGHEAAKKDESKLVSVGICALLILIGGAFACVIAWRLIGGA